MSVRYLLDTNICIYIIKKQPERVLHKFEELLVGTVGMSTITHGELLYGAYKSQRTQKNLSLLAEIVTLIPPLPMPTQISQHYGCVRNTLEQKGQIIGNNDLWIAAHALSLDVVLVTHNTKEFSRVPKLKIENWVS